MHSFLIRFEFEIATRGAVTIYRSTIRAPTDARLLGVHSAYVLSHKWTAQKRGSERKFLQRALKVTRSSPRRERAKVSCVVLQRGHATEKREKKKSGGGGKGKTETARNPASATPFSPCTKNKENSYYRV